MEETTADPCADSIYHLALLLVGAFGDVQHDIDTCVRQYVRTNAPVVVSVLERALEQPRDEDRLAAVREFNRHFGGLFDAASFASTYSKAKDVRDGIAHRFSVVAGDEHMYFRNKPKKPLPQMSKERIRDIWMEVVWLSTCVQLVRIRLGLFFEGADLSVWQPYLDSLYVPYKNVEQFNERRKTEKNPTGLHSSWPQEKCDAFMTSLSVVPADGGRDGQ